MTTDAGGTPGGSTATGLPWTDWPTTASWGMVMEEMEKYLAGRRRRRTAPSVRPSRSALEAGRYNASVGRMFLSTDTSKPDRGSAPLQRRSRRSTTRYEEQLRCNWPSATTKPGAYIFTLNPTPGDDQKAKPPEYLATVFNIDTAREVALQRAKGNDLAEQAKGAEVHAADDTSWLDSLKQKQTDMSSGRWIYLVVLLVLIIEQAMAVRLSHHANPTISKPTRRRRGGVFARHAAVGCRGCGSRAGGGGTRKPARNESVTTV